MEVRKASPVVMIAQTIRASLLANATATILAGLRALSAASYGGTGAARAIEHLRNILAEEQVASLKHTVHIGMIEALGIMREGKSMADYPYLDDFAKRMLDEIVWWANTLKEGRSGDQVAEAA
jgi:NAD(P)H-dependent FMN reductase